MWEKIKNGIKYLFKDVIWPNIIWKLVVAIASICGIGKIWSIVKTLVENKNVSTLEYVILGVCTVVCVGGLICIYVLFRAEKSVSKELKSEQESLKREKSNLEKEKSNLEKEKADLEKEKVAIEEEKRKMEADNVVPPFPPLESRYTISEISFELFFKDREHIVQRQTVCYKVEAPYLEQIHHNMMWTGDGYSGSHLFKESKKKGYRLEEKRTNTSMIDIVVSFPEQKTKGFSDSYSFETEVTDMQHQMLPNLSRLIKCYTGKLTLKVTVPEGMIESCKQYVSADLTSDFILGEPQEVKPDMVGNNCCYRHEFEKLELLRYYRLEWVFKEQPDKIAE